MWLIVLCAIVFGVVAGAVVATVLTIDKLSGKLDEKKRWWEE